MFWSFGREACGVLAPLPGIEPAPSALEGKVLTTGPPGKSQVQCFETEQAKHRFLYLFSSLLSSCLV